MKIKTPKRRKTLLTRRSFFAQASTFAAAAGLPLAVRPFFRDFLLNNAQASSEYNGPPRTICISDSGGAPGCSYFWPGLTWPGGSTPHPNLAFYKRLGQEAVDISTGGRILRMPPPYAAMSSTVTQNLSSHGGIVRGPGGHPPVNLTPGLTDGSQNSLGVFCSREFLNKFSGLTPVVPGIDFISNGATVSQNVDLSAAHNPASIIFSNFATPSESTTNLVDLFLPIQPVSLNTGEVDLIKAALNWVAELFGNKAVNTFGVHDAVNSVQAGSALFNINYGLELKAIIEDPTLNLASVYESGDIFNPTTSPLTPGKDGIALGRFFHLLEAIFRVQSAVLATNFSYAMSTFDWHRMILPENTTEPLFGFQEMLAQKLNIFLTRMQNIPDPLGLGQFSIADNLLLKITAVQGRNTINDGGWSDDPNQFILVYNGAPSGCPRIKPGTWGDIMPDGSPRGVDPNGNPLPAGISGDMRYFLNTIYKAARVDHEIRNSGHNPGQLT